MESTKRVGQIEFKECTVIRKIAAHYYLNEVGEIVKFPIISFVDGIITNIESYTTLPEIAGLEFYSGTLLPLFIDVIAPKSLNELEESSSFRSSLVSKVVVDFTFFDSLAYLACGINRDRIIALDGERFSSLFIVNSDNISVFKKIERMVNSRRFKSQMEGVIYFSIGLSKLLGINVHSIICEGARAEFILCSDLNLVRGGCANEAKFRRLI